MKRWDALPSRRRAILRYTFPLLCLAILIALDWWYLQRKGVTTPSEGVNLLRNVGWTLLLGALVMLAGVRRWPLTSLGLLALLLGIAGAFVRVFGRVGPQPVSENERDAIQAALDVGSRVLVIGIVIWAIGRAFGRGGPAPINGNGERVYVERAEDDRHKGWGRLPQ